MRKDFVQVLKQIENSLIASRHLYPHDTIHEKLVTDALAAVASLQPCDSAMQVAQEALEKIKLHTSQTRDTTTRWLAIEALEKMEEHAATQKHAAVAKLTYELPSAYTKPAIFSLIDDLVLAWQESADEQEQADRRIKARAELDAAINAHAEPTLAMAIPEGWNIRQLANPDEYRVELPGAGATTVSVQSRDPREMLLACLAEMMIAARKSSADAAPHTLAYSVQTQTTA
jgi:hypothetical protein